MKLRLLFLALLVSLFLNPLWAQAQGKITVNILDPFWVEPDTIIPIGGTEITNSADATLSITAEIRKSLPDTAILAKFKNDITKISGSLDSITRDIKQYEPEEIGSGLIDNYIGQLSLLQTAFTSLKADLDKRTKTIQKHWYILDFLINTWEKTLKSNQDQTQNELVRIRSTDMLSILKEQRFVVVQMSDQLLILDDKLLTGKQSLDHMLKQLNDAKELFQRSYLTKSYPALWEADTVYFTGYKDLFRATFVAYRTGISGFYNPKEARLYFHLGILLIFLLSTFAVRKILRKRNYNYNDPKIRTFYEVFSKPISISLTSVFFIALIAYPNAPTSVKDIFSFLIIIPLLIVTLQVLPKNTHTYLYVVSALFLFTEIVDMIKYGNFPFPYLLIFIVLLSTLIYLFWLIIHHRKNKKKLFIKKLGYTELILWASLLIILAAAISNIVGYVPLSFFLLRGLVVSIMSGLLTRVSVTVAEAFLKLIILGNSSEAYGSIFEYGEKLLLIILGVVKFFVTVFWITIVLKAFLIYGPILDWLGTILDAKAVVGTITISLKGILLFGVVLFISIWISRFIRLLLEKEVFPRVKMSRGVPGMIILILRVIIMTTGVVLALAAIGIDFNKLTILMGALGVGIGFGLQDIINNLISGLVLVFERPIQVGDTVQFGNREGLVKEIGIRSSTIKTYDGSEVIVPNGKLISNELINLTLSDPILRLEIDIGTDYGSDPQEVIDILLMQAKLHPKVNKNPEAFAIFLGFGDYSLNFRLYAYTQEVSLRLRIKSELNLAIFQALSEANIKIPFPIQDLNIHMTEDADNTKKEVVPRKKKD